MAAPNFPNRTLYHADNLPVLRGMDSETVDLIATDPPFNKGKDFHATPDSLAAGAKFQDRWSWTNDVEGEWVDQITDDHPKVMTVINAARESYGDDMGAFLCFLGVRLLAMRRILKPTGSLYLHIDHTAHAYVKALMDAIFGKRNFRNEIVWHYTNSGGRGKSIYARKHDTLLWYSKTKDYFFDGSRNGQPRAAGTTSKGGRIFEKNGKTYQQIWSKGKSYTYCLSDDRIADDVWPIQPIPPHGRERVGWPTQKPLALYERIVENASNPGDMVLDPFAGCATTLVAAERLGRQWAGIDIWDGAFGIVKQRMEDNRQLLRDIPTLPPVETEPPIRTDGGEAAAPFIQVTERYREPGPRMSRQEMYEHLLAQYGSKCQGCDRTFDDSRYLELDHNTPRSDGGINHITNRVLLCSPCNRAKSNTLTLSGLRRLNKRNGWMKGE